METIKADNLGEYMDQIKDDYKAYVPVICHFDAHHKTLTWSPVTTQFYQNRTSEVDENGVEKTIFGETVKLEG